MRGGIDASAIRKLATGLGTDTRTWVAYATVDEEVSDSHSVEFDEDMGPLVTVTLHGNVPNRTIVCRVAAGVSGAGTSEYSPLIAKQEVLVVIPGGMISDYGVIIGVLPNGLDTWPRVVAGQDSTKNNFSFTRRRTPHITESASAMLFRNATTGSQFGLDDKGQIILNDGDGSQFFMGADAVGFTTADKDAGVQGFPAKKSVLIFGGAASLEVKESTTEFISTGSISFATNGGFASQHGVSMEQVVNMLINYTIALYASGVVVPGAPPTAGTLLTLITAMLGGCILPTPPGPAPGGNLAAFYTQIAAALNVPQDPTGIITGAGKPGFLM